MAFNRASGYNNLPSGNFTPEIFSQKVLKFFRRASVAEDITNTDYAGEIENFGDTVRIIKEPTITVSSYARGSVVNPQDLADDQITMEALYPVGKDGPLDEDLSRLYARLMEVSIKQRCATTEQGMEETAGAHGGTGAIG